MRYLLLAVLSCFLITAHAKPNKIMMMNQDGAETSPPPGLHAIQFMPGLYVGTPLDDSEALVLNAVPVPGSHEELEVSTASILLKTPDQTSAPISNWWNAGFTGKSAVIGVLDSGVPDTYENAQGSFTRQSGLLNKNMRVNRSETSGFDRYLNGVRTAHGTGVACIYGNEQVDRPGIAYGVNDMLVTLAGDSDVDDTDWELTLLNLDWLLTTPGQPKPTTINYSFGNGELVEDWSLVAQTVDYIVNQYGITWVKSAGNDGWVEPSDTAPFANSLSVPADSYNAIVVANMNNTLSKTSTTLVKTSNRSQHTIQSSSSRGPTRDGRRKPDITAPGNDTRTCAPTENIYAIPENPTFKPYSTSMQYDAVSETRLVGGTSMATPHVGGTSALIYDSGIHDPKAIKALLINSADAWADNGAVPGSLWNRTYGWGYINMDNAFHEKDFVYEGKLRPSTPRCYVGDIKPNDKVTLVWERRVDTKRMYAFTPMQLTLYRPADHTLLAQDNSRIDNVLQVSHTDDNAHQVRVDIRIPDDVHRIDGSRDEPFALASSVRLKPVSCDLLLRALPQPVHRAE